MHVRLINALWTRYKFATTGNLSCDTSASSGLEREGAFDGYPGAEGIQHHTVALGILQQALGSIGASIIFDRDAGITPDTPHAYRYIA